MKKKRLSKTEIVEHLKRVGLIPAFAEKQAELRARRDAAKAAAAEGGA